MLKPLHKQKQFGAFEASSALQKAAEKEIKHFYKNCKKS